VRWEYPAGAWMRKVDGSGKVKLDGRNWNLSQALAGDWVQLIQLEERVQVDYGNTLIRELECKGCSVTKTVKDVPGRFVNHVSGLETSLERGTLKSRCT
jgi:hypothetical protein